MSEISIDKLAIELMGETIVEGFDLHLTAGKVACLYGASGCGKTTILRAIAHLVAIKAGDIANRFSRPTYLFQEHRLLPWRTAWENIALIRPQQSAHHADDIGDLLTRLGFSANDWQKYPHELSGGMRQRVALARALINQPDLLLMDEPFSALDFELKQSLQQLILQRVKEDFMSIILVTHDRYEALRLADSIYLLSEHKPTHCQRIIHLTTPQQQRHASFIERYLVPEFWALSAGSQSL